MKSLLNHKIDDDVTAGYVISEAERLRAAMQRITDTLVKIIEDKDEPDAEKEPKPGLTVVAISSVRNADIDF